MPEYLAPVADLAKMERMEASQRRESLGELAAKIAHDFNNSLTIIKSYADLMLKDVLENDPWRTPIREIQKAADQAANLARQILAFASNRVIASKVFAINRVVKEMKDMLHMNVGENIRLSLNLAPNLGYVKTDPGQLFQCIHNLVSNARDAINGPGTITIRTENQYLESESEASALGLAPGHYVMIEVKDNGGGIPEFIQEKIFDPFFTTKAPDKGTGLGLATVHNFFTRQGGTVKVFSPPGEGTAFRAYLPRVYESLEPDALLPSGPEKCGLGETILLVEDEAAVLNVTKQILTQAGYRVLAASDGEMALAIYEKLNEPINVVLTDVRMPKMNGRELVDRLRARQPGLKAIFMSGFSSDIISRNGILEKGFYFISKPYSIEGIRSKLREVLDDDSC